MSQRLATQFNTGFAEHFFLAVQRQAVVHFVAEDVRQQAWRCHAFGNDGGGSSAMCIEALVFSRSQVWQLYFGRPCLITQISAGINSSSLT